MCGPIRRRFVGARAAAVARFGALLNHRNFSVPQARFVLVDDGGFDYRVEVAMHNRHRLRERRQKIIVVERA